MMMEKATFVLWALLLSSSCNSAAIGAAPPGQTSARWNREYFQFDEEAHFAPISATFLQRSPRFQPDEVKYKIDFGPWITFDKEKKKVTISAKTGIAWIGFRAKRNVIDYHEPPKPYPEKLEFSHKQLKEMSGGKQIPYSVSVMTATGSTRSWPSKTVAIIQEANNSGKSRL